MRRLEFLFITALAMLVLSACGGSSLQPSVPATGQQSVAEPPPIEPAAARRVLTKAPASEAVPTLLRTVGRSRLNARVPKSIVPAGEVEHSFAGLLLNDNPFTGIYSVHSVYLPDTQLTIPFPAGQVFTGAQELIFAPTTKLPANCLENGSTYFSEDTGQTFAYFYVFDFCGDGGFVYLRGLDPAFMASYARPLDGVQSYIVESLNVGTQTAPAWRTLLYNFAQNRWDAVFTQNGTSPAGGWSIFEYYLLPGQCPPGLPTMQARQIKFYDPVSAQWVHVGPSDASVQTGYPDSCFSDAPASYVFKLVQPDWWWTVTSTGS